MTECNARVEILTKSDLVLRDIDNLKKIQCLCWDFNEYMR